MSKDLAAILGWLVLIIAVFFLSAWIHQIVFNFSISEVFNIKVISYKESMRLILYYWTLAGYLKVSSSDTKK
jgi:hypothetical protein